MAYLLQNPSAFWPGQKQIKSHSIQDPKPQCFVNIFIQEGEHLTKASIRIPEPILKAFCSVATISQCSSSFSKAVILEEVTMEAVMHILTWMHDCSKANKIIPFPRIEELPYTSYVSIKYASKALHFTGLFDEMEKRCGKLVATQIHTNDIKTVYHTFPAEGAGSAHRKLASLSIAKATQEKRLKASKASNQLKEEIPDFYQDVLDRLPKAFQNKWAKKETTRSKSTEYTLLRDQSSKIPRRYHKTGSPQAQPQQQEFTVKAEDFPELGK